MILSNYERLEAALRDALRSVLSGTVTGVNPRVEFYNKFQREMEEHDQDFNSKYDEDLNTTLIFVSIDLMIRALRIAGSHAHYGTLYSPVYSPQLLPRLSSICNRSSNQIMKE